MFKLSFFLITYFACFAAAEASQKKYPESIGIVGESISTGAAASPELVADPEQLLWGLLSGALDLFSPLAGDVDTSPKLQHYSRPDDFNIKAPIYPPVRVWWTPDEINANNRPGKAKGNRLKDSLVDVEEYSWGYLLGRKLNILPHQIYLAAQDGDHTDGIFDQILRLQIKYRPEALYGLPGHLPEAVFVLMNGSELCELGGPITDPDASFRQLTSQFETSFRAQLNSVIQKAIVHPNGTSFYFVAPIDFTQILDNEALLNKKIEYDDKTIQCRQLREELPDSTLFGLNFPLKFMRDMCKGLLKTHWQDKQKIHFLRRLGKELAQIQEDIVSETSKNLPKNKKLRLYYLKSTKTVQFKPDEIANECSHLSVKGNELIADTIYNELFN